MLYIIFIFFLQTGYFRPIDGWEMTFSNWDRFEPEMQQSCVYVNNENGKWKTADCAHNMASVCMKSTGRAHVKSDKAILHFWCYELFYFISLF